MNRIVVVTVSHKQDKILVWIGSELVHYFIAADLQKKIDGDFFAIFDTTNKPKKFFETQNIVNFKKKWFYHDEIQNIDKNQPDIEFLKKMEEKYQINFWKLAINERIFYRFYNFHNFSENEILSIEEKSMRFFEKIFEEVKPDYFLTKQPSFHHLELFKSMCEKNKCKPIMLSYPKLAYRMLISEDVNKIDYLSELKSYHKEGKTFEEMREYLDKHSSFNQLKNYYKKSEKRIIPQMTALKEYLFSDNLNLQTNYNYFGRTKFRVLSNLLHDKKQRKNRERFMEKKLPKKADLKKPFIYFPMATDLERHLLIDSPFYTNQIEVIRNIAKSIPIGYTIYAKENPSNITRNWRSISQYHEIMEIPNVNLLHPEFSNKELLKKSDLVISIAGSSSFEATFYEKPSIVFGDVLYKILPSVTKVKEIEKLPQLIKESLKRKVDPEDLEKFLTMLKENTFDFDMVEFSRSIAEKFYHDASLVDVNIEKSAIEEFISENSKLIEILSIEHIKKIEQHKSKSKINR